jgi:predicted MFS family arabinose efflux permease
VTRRGGNAGSSPRARPGVCAAGSFGIGLAEFVIAGLLPQVGRGLRVSDAAAGWLISGYAPTVAVGAIAVTAATSRLPRKAVLIGPVALFVVGNLLSAVAPDHPVMLLGRVVAALRHGTFFRHRLARRAPGLAHHVLRHRRDRPRRVDRHRRAGAGPGGPSESRGP